MPASKYDERRRSRVGVRAEAWEAWEDREVMEDVSDATERALPARLESLLKLPPLPGEVFAASRCWLA